MNKKNWGDRGLSGRTWFLDLNSVPSFISYGDNPITDHCYDDWNELGLCFESEQEAEDFIEKLKAWKRLKDKGFRFILDGETEMPMFVYSGANGEKCITSAEESKQCRDDIKLLFGGEDE